jgi:hypothetical protein
LKIFKSGISQDSIEQIDIERKLAEAYLLDPGGPDFFKALKRYNKQAGVKSDQIAHYDKIKKMKLLLHLQQEFAND